jgi:putative oxidoreductase
MTFNDATTSRFAQRVSLLLLRVTTGFLLIWVGLNKVFSGTAPMVIRRSMKLDEATETIVSLATGSAQVLIGVLCVIGLWRRLALPVQALINGSTAVAVWWAILDPFRWYITGVDRIVFNSHVFYPTSITFAACVLLIAFQRGDTWSVDAYRSKKL